MATTTGTPCTPPSKSQIQLAPDTQPVQRFASQSDYRSGDLSLGRQAVLKDLGRYIQVPYATLVRSVFGSSLPGTTHVRRKLADDHVLNDTTSKWAGFTDTPARSNVSEYQTFRPLVDIISKIFDEVPGCNVFIVGDSTTTPLSERKNTSRPDAYVVHKGPAAKQKRDLAQKPIHWFDIAIPFEFKKTNDRGSKHDNEQKIIWSLHHIMREDPLRRFALGVTIEDTIMRFWCNNRAFVAVSEPIDFCTKIDDFVSLFYFIGNMPEVQLGWDPTVERICVGKEFQYQFKICDHSFTTTRPLATYGADVIVGRGTRVYEAQDEEGKLVAIKDSWRDEDRDPEGAILEKIFHDIRGKFGEDEAAEAKRYFVMVRAYEDVIISGECDKTFKLTDGEGNFRLTWTSIDVTPILSERRHLLSTGHIPDSECLPTKIMRRWTSPVDFPRRTHTRTVFEEVGIPLMAVNCLADNFACLSGARKALYYLHKAGWVHRDFSVANVLWVETDRQLIGKLTDFEYAKKVDSETSHDVRTGTMHFMAVEVESQSYLFMPEDHVAGPEPPFRMNFLHDLESVWWAAVWAIFRHTDANSPTSKSDSQIEYFNQAFPPAIAQLGRRDFFNFAQKRWLASQTLSVTYRDACDGVIDLARHLKECYRIAEISYPLIKLDNDLLEVAHKKAADAHSDAIRALKESGIHLLPLHRSLGGKRDSRDSNSSLPSPQTMKKGRWE